MFGERLKLLRTQRGLSQVQMADVLGFKDKVSTYRAYELEYSQPSIALLINLADFFGVTVDFLIGRTHDSQRPPVPEIEMQLEADQRGRYSHIKNVFDTLIISTRNNRNDLMTHLLELLEGIDWTYNGSYPGEARLANGGKLGYDEYMTNSIMNDIEKIDLQVINPLRKHLINVIHLNYYKEIHEADKLAD